MKINPFTYRIKKNKILVNKREIDLSGYSCIAVMGAVGSGKSQLIKLLADSNLREAGAFSDYPFCAYLSQDLTRLFTGNTPEKILELYRDKRYTVGKHFDLRLFDNYASKLRIDSLLGKNRRLAHYSEGERQRLGVCLAAAVRAPVTILDEPSTALDIRCRQELFSIIGEIRQRSLVFIISHRLLDALATADYMIWMKDLSVSDRFPLEDIVKKPHILSCYTGVDEKYYV
ncbi:MAG: ATP-binding cassette domain-containing protein [Fidelibacterota bacterium]